MTSGTYKLGQDSPNTEGQSGEVGLTQRGQESRTNIMGRECGRRTAWIGQLGGDSQDRTAGKRTVRTGQLERTVGIIQPGQVREDSKYKTVQGQSSKMGLDNSA
jgi:hypothetical protein